VDGDLRLASLRGLEASSGNPAAVGEESHLEDMRSAIRGDFERLAERRGDQELMRVSAGAAQPYAAESPQPEAEPRDEGEAEKPRSWLARFLAP
jgi:hypothetical protein